MRSGCTSPHELRLYGGSLDEAPAAQGGSVSLTLPLEAREGLELGPPSS